MNYGETLAYWYLRLNGFIPMTNFVLHAPDERNKYNSDTDILAVRFRHSFEVVGGQRGDFDIKRFDRWGLKIFDATVCVIAEVKTGTYKKSNINQAFSRGRLLYAIRRIGILSPNASEEAASELEDEVAVRHGDIQFAKVLFHNPKFAPSPTSEGRLALKPYFKLSLDDANQFIMRRMKNYKDHKGVARMLFPGDLIQFLAWSAGLPPVVQGEEE